MTGELCPSSAIGSAMLNGVEYARSNLSQFYFAGALAAYCRPHFARKDDNCLGLRHGGAEERTRLQSDYSSEANALSE
jgi:hypothetical protein